MLQNLSIKPVPFLFWSGYSLFRGEIHLQFYKTISKRLALGCNIAGQCIEKQEEDNRNNIANVQGFKDRCLRIRTIEKETASLLESLDKLQNYHRQFSVFLPTYLKVAYAVLNWFHSWYLPPDRLDWVKELKSEKLPMNFADFNQKFCPQIGSIPDSFTGEKLGIFARFDQKFSGTTILTLRREREDEQVVASATLSIEKKSATNAPTSSIEFLSTPEEDKKLSFRKLCIKDVYNHQPIDPKTSDSPSMRALVQAIVQIFFQESVKTLWISSSNENNFIWAAAGFKGLVNTSKEVETELQDAKNEGKIFPDSGGAYSITFEMKKPKNEEEPFDPQVRFQPNNTAESWTTLIRANPLLFTNGPILPN